MANPRLDAAYAAQVKAVRQRLTTFAGARFAAGQYRDADLERFLVAVVPVVLAARRQVSALTDAYLSAVMSDLLGRRVAPRGPIDTDSLRGTPVGEVYGRPYVTVRTKLAEGLNLSAAISAGAARLTDIALTDLQLAKTQTAQRSLDTKGVGGFRRVLTGDKSCDLCVAASEHHYRRGDLMPIHPGCDCGVEPTRGEGSTARMDGVAVRAHGEIGPVLAVAGQHFDGPSVAN